MFQQFIEEISYKIPADRLNRDYMRRLAWGTDAGFYRLIPQLVIHTAHEEEVVHIVKTAQKNKIPLTFRAAGTSLSGQSVTDSVLVIVGKNWEKFQLPEIKESIDYFNQALQELN